MNIQEYKDSDRVNYSKLSALAVRPYYYYKRYILKDSSIEEDIKENIGVTSGKLLDLLMFAPSDFDSNFYIGKDTAATDTVKRIIKALYLLIKEKGELENKPDISDWKEEIYDIASVEEYGKNWHKATVINKVIEYGHNYFDDLKNSGNRMIISSELFINIKQALLSLQGDPFTDKIFSNALSSNIHIIYQLPIFWATNHRGCKSLLDIVIINKAGRTILPIDLKGTSDTVYSFPLVFKKWKYYLQASFYTDALISWKNNDETAKEFVDFEVLPFEFIVQEFHLSNPPLVYKCTDNDLKVGRDGGYSRTGEKIKGYRQLLTELEQLESYENRWEHGSSYYDNKCEYIDIFSKNVSNT